MAFITQSRITVARNPLRQLLKKLHCARTVASQRHQLAKLDARTLADIGISPAQRDAELARGFFDF